MGRFMASRTRAGLRLVVPPVLAGALLVGCSGDDDAPVPSGSPTPADTATLEPTPSDNATTTPEPDPTAELEAEITAFFEEYIDAVNESWTSKEALRRRHEMFADSCRECQTGYELAHRTHEEALVLDAGDVVVLDVELTSFDGETAVFLTDMDSPAGVLRTSSGEVVQEFDDYSGVQSVYQATKTSKGEWIIISGEVL